MVICNQELTAIQAAMFCNQELTAIKIAIDSNQDLFLLANQVEIHDKDNVQLLRGHNFLTNYFRISIQSILKLKQTTIFLILYQKAEMQFIGI